MKKSKIVIIGILLGTIFVSQQLLSLSVQAKDDDPPEVQSAVSELKVFPNPSDGRFQLTFEYSGKEKMNAKIYDITGKQVKDITEDIVLADQSVSAQVDLESPSSGIYFVRIEWGNSLLTKKIIVR